MFSGGFLGAGGATLVGALMSESARPVRRTWPPARPMLPAFTVGSVHLVSGMHPDALLGEVFTNEGSGTMLRRSEKGAS